MTSPAPLEGAREALARALPIDPDDGTVVTGFEWHEGLPLRVPEWGPPETLADTLLAALSFAGYQVVKVEETWWQYGRRELPDAGEMVVFERRPVPLNGMQRVQRRPVAPVGPWVPVSGEGRDD